MERGKKTRRLIGHYREDKGSHWHAFLQAVSANVGIPILDLLTSSVGGAHEGSWAHPLVAIDIARWLHPAFAVQVMSWTGRFLSGDLALTTALVHNHAAATPDRKVRAGTLYAEKVQGGESTLGVEVTRESEAQRPICRQDEETYKDDQVHHMHAHGQCGSVRLPAARRGVFEKQRPFSLCAN